MIVNRIFFDRHCNSKKQSEWQNKECRKIVQLYCYRKAFQHTLKYRYPRSHFKRVTKIKVQIVCHRVSKLSNQRIIQMILIHDHFANGRIQLWGKINNVPRHGMKHKENNNQNDNKCQKSRNQSLYNVFDHLVSLFLIYAARSRMLWRHLYRNFS